MKNVLISDLKVDPKLEVFNHGIPLRYELPVRTHKTHILWQPPKYTTGFLVDSIQLKLNPKIKVILDPNQETCRCGDLYEVEFEGELNCYGDSELIHTETRLLVLLTKRQLDKVYQLCYAAGHLILTTDLIEKLTLDNLYVFQHSLCAGRIGPEGKRVDSLDSIDVELWYFRSKKRR